MKNVYVYTSHALDGKEKNVEYISYNVTMNDEVEFNFTCLIMHEFTRSVNSSKKIGSQLIRCLCEYNSINMNINALLYLYV